MNKCESDILNALILEPFINQRVLSESSGYSLGMVNRSVKNLCAIGYLDSNFSLTAKAKEEMLNKKPKNAIILAAGYGMRMVPINMEVPKGLLEIHGEPLIERLIKQLQEVGITDIYIVVGYMKERYEYLIDLYQVQLIVNMEYSSKNNLHSLAKVLPYLSNSYIIPCDIWCDKNPFKSYEFYSWYLVSEEASNESSVRVNRKSELVVVSPESGGNTMIGICYLLEEQAQFVRKRIETMSQNRKYDESFWEDALYENGRMIVYAKVAHACDVVEINTYEQLRDLDSHSNQLQTNAISEIAKVMDVSPQDIVDITILKKGMTNRSFLFSCHDQRYIMRIPGEGTDRLINRKQEAAVYDAIKNICICDDIVYLNPENGYKITEYIDNAHTCDPMSKDEVKACMQRLKEFHEAALKVDHTFDIFGQIQYYEDLWLGQQSAYRDYSQTKQNILSLKSWIEKQPKKWSLAYIDAVPDNFLFFEKPDGTRSIRLIDWEYAGMQDPHVDIAMFCIYALYDKNQVDELIDIYFEGNCPDTVRIKIYCYIAACGLLWSNWCEYKRNLGIEFGEYALRQYRYAKEYYRIVRKYLLERGEINA